MHQHTPTLIWHLQKRTSRVFSPGYKMPPLLLAWIPLDLASILRTCSLRRSYGYVYAREHAKATRYRRAISGNWCNIRAYLSAGQVDMNGRRYSRQLPIPGTTVGGPTTARPGRLQQGAVVSLQLVETQAGNETRKTHPGGQPPHVREVGRQKPGSHQHTLIHQ